MNATLHAKIESPFSALQQSGTWFRRPAGENFSQEDVTILGAFFALPFWLVGAFVYCHALSNVSLMLLRHTISMALLAANLMLAYAVLWLDVTELYVYFLCILWPINGAMACKFLTRNM